MSDCKRNIGTSVYIIDETYHIVYFDEGFRSLFPETRIGDLCCEVLGNGVEPCQECPLLSSNAQSSILYIGKLERWMELNIGNVVWPDKGDCSVIILKDSSEPEDASTCGQNDFAIDVFTGLYNKQAFFRAAEARLSDEAEEVHCLVAIDIEHFKLFNEWYGQPAGDEFLIHMGKYLKNIEMKTGGIAGYLGEDDFCILLPYGKDNLHHMQEEIMGYVKQYGGSAGFLPAFGVFEITDRTLPVIMMYDRAVIALSSVKGNYVKRLGKYDEVMMRKLEENHVLLSEVQKGLEQKEFTFYLQPKCNMATGRIIGLESLVRWNHPEKGLVMPGSFIPYLEESGFIVNLDIYIWNEVCRYLRKWLDEGLELLPVSVNVSRIDIYTMDVPEYFKNLAKKYGIPLKLLEIEITESAFAEEFQIIPQVAENMRNAGFTVLMDDFGSGYSSLNMLKDVNVDVLKIDMKFLEMNEQSTDKGLGILEAIIRMARFMEMRMIAEGVETAEQVKFLVDMGCLYGQGYHFYRPLSIEKFEELMANPDNFDYRGISAANMKGLGIKDLLNPDMFSETLLHNILGAIGFYKVTESNVELLQVNEYYYKVTRSNPIDLEEQRGHIQSRIYEEDREIFQAIFTLADQNKLDGGSGEIRRLCDDGSTIWIQLRIFFIKEQEDGRLYYGAIADVTEQKRREQILQSSQRALRSVVSIAENDMPFAKLADENQKTAAAIFAQMAPGGMIGGYCEDGFPLYFANAAMVKLMGYDSYSELEEAIHGKVINTIHPDDREQVAKDIGSEYYDGLEYTTKYRIPRKDGTWFWTQDRGKVIRAEDGRLAIISVCMDITKNINMQEELLEKNDLLSKQKMSSILRQAKISSWEWSLKTRTLTLGNIQQNSRVTCDYIDMQVDRAVILNFPESALGSGVLDKEYENRLIQYFGDMYEGDHQEHRSCEIPLKLKDGSLCWVRIVCELVEDEAGNPIEAIGYYLDITKEKEVDIQSRENTKTLEVFRKQALYDFKVSLTRNYLCISECAIEWLNETGYDQNMKFSDIREYLCKELILEPHREQFRRFTDINRMLQAFQSGKMTESQEYQRLYRGFGHWMCMTVNYFCLENGGEIFAYIFIKDIDTQKRQELHLTKMAETDAMTGLYNRHAAKTKIEEYLLEHSSRNAAVIMFDMDNFKCVNDVFGHTYGDSVIRQNAVKLKQFFRADDVICRMGGDEFLVLCKNINEDEIHEKLERIIKDMAVAFETDDKNIEFSISAGCAVVPGQGSKFDELYRKADVALFTAKLNGKSTFLKYDSTMKDVRYELADTSFE